MQPRASASSAPGRRSRWLARVGRWIAPEVNPSGVVYGLIAAGALLAAESTRRETLAEAIAASAVTMVLYWLAHTYAHALGSRIESGQKLTAGGILRTAAHEAALLKGAALPVAVLVLAALGGAGPPGAVMAALVASAMLLVVLELIAGRRAQMTGLALFAQVMVAGALGAGVVVLKLVIH